MSFDHLAALPSLLGIRPGMRVSVLNPPAGFMARLDPLPDGVSLIDESRTGLDVTVFFVTRKTDLVARLPALARGMAVTGRVWVCFARGAEDTQALSEDFIRLAGLEIGLTDDKKVVLSSEWTGLRLAWKPRSPRLEKPQAEA